MSTIQWNKERIESLSTEEVRNLLNNALERKRQDIADLCNEVLAIRKTHARTRQTSRSISPHKQIEHELDQKLVDLHIELNQLYDLSPTKAKQLSAEVKGFKAHNQLSSKGRSKTGAHQTKTKQLALDRYISYRLKNSVCALICVQFLNEDQVRFHVMGPATLLTNNYKDPKTLRPYLNDSNEKLGSYEGGEEYFTFEEASKRYEWLIGKIAPPKI